MTQIRRSNRKSELVDDRWSATKKNAAGDRSATKKSTSSVLAGDRIGDTAWVAGADRGESETEE